MALPNTLCGYLTATLSDQLPQYILGPIIPLLLSALINVREISHDLIKKTLFLIIFQLLGKSYCLHQT